MADKLLTVVELAGRVGVGVEQARLALNLLQRFEDVYPSLLVENGRSRLYYCYAPSTLADLCKRRAISVAKFLQLAPLLDEFMLKVEDYYTNRAHEDGIQRTTLRKLKREYAKRIYPLVFNGGRSLKEWNFPISTHRVWRYIRTAQDLVALKLDIPRPYLDKMKDASASTRDTSSQEVNTLPKNNDKQALVTIKCKDCGKERQIKPQDVFQVKRCAEHQKAYRLQRARERRKAKRKNGAARKAAKPKAAKSKPKTKPATPSPGTVPAPGAPEVQLVDVMQP